MKRAASMLTAFGIGSGLMYFLDPDRGRRRRSLVQEKSLSTVRHLNNAIATTARDFSNRMRGVAGETRSMVSGKHVSDEVLAARIETKIGRVVSHPGSIEVTASQGQVRLRGPVLDSEVDNLIRAVRSVRDRKSVV